MKKSRKVLTGILGAVLAIALLSGIALAGNGTDSRRQSADKPADSCGCETCDKTCDQARDQHKQSLQDCTCDGTCDQEGSMKGQNAEATEQQSRTQTQCMTCEENEGEDTQMNQENKKTRECQDSPAAELNEAGEAAGSQKRRGK